MSASNDPSDDDAHDFSALVAALPASKPSVSRAEPPLEQSAIPLESGKLAFNAPSPVLDSQTIPMTTASPGVTCKPVRWYIVYKR